MSDTAPPGAARSFVGAPIDPWTYRSLAYLLLAVPIGVTYLVVLTVGFSLTIGLSVTLLGPVALVATLLTVVSLAWVDAKFTGGLLGAELSPGFPDTERGVVEFTKALVLGRATWVGLAYLAWRVVLGFVALFVLTFGLSLAASLLAAPFAYGDHLAVQYRLGSYTIDTLGSAIAAAGVGALVGLLTLYATNLLGRAAAGVAHALLDTSPGDQRAAPAVADP